MVTVVNRSQQVYTAGLSPKAVYSRVVSVELVVFQGWGWQYVVTPPLGNDVWLLGVDVLIEPKALDNSQYYEFVINAGGGKVSDMASVANWGRVFPKINNSQISQVWRIGDGARGIHWAFAKFYKGESRRFAVSGLRVGEDTGILQVSFTVSEG